MSEHPPAAPAGPRDGGAQRTGTPRDAREAYEGALDAESARGGTRAVAMVFAAASWLVAGVWWWLADRPWAWLALLPAAFALVLTVALLPRPRRGRNRPRR